jgi:hypothetical protein
MVAGVLGLQIFDQRQRQVRAQLVLRARQAGLEAVLFESRSSFVFLPASLRRLGSKTRVQFTLDSPDEMLTLRSLGTDRAGWGCIILNFMADAAQVEWLRTEFPDVPLFEHPPGKTWLRPVTR